MKCFERLVMRHLKLTINVADQYANRRNQSTADAISAVTHQALSGEQGLLREAPLDFSSAFNMIIPQKLVSKLAALGVSSSLCNWVLDFLTCRPQSVRINNISSSIILSTGSPQGCVQSTAVHTDGP